MNALNKPVVFLRIPKTASCSILDYLARLNVEVVRNPKGKPSHAPPDRIRYRMGEKAWSSAFKFSCVRNPWDRMVAYYYGEISRHRLTSKVSFRDWLLSLKKPKYRTKATRPQSSWYSIDGEVITDFIVRLEKIEIDLRTPFPSDIELKRLHSHPEPKGYNYREYYDDECQEYIAEWEKDVIRDFRYKF